MQHGFGGSCVIAFDERRVARPADFDAAKQIRFRPRHAEQGCGPEMGFAAENVDIGAEDNRRAAPVHRAAFFQFSLRRAAAVALRIKLFVTRDLDRQFFGQAR